MDTIRHASHAVDSTNHYEAAVAAYLRERRWCYLAIDESRRALNDAASWKSPDLLLYGGSGARFLVDVKGRRFPGGPPGKPRRVWECWATREDVDGLERWSQRCGPGYQGLLLFAYELAPSVRLPEGTPDLFEHRGRRYLFRAVCVADFRRFMRRRSPKWDTVDLPGAAFRMLVQPLAAFVTPRTSVPVA